MRGNDQAKIVLAICLDNAISIVAFTYLACVFDKWYIALFSIVFQTSIKRIRYEENKGDEADD